ncbi:uncharacterized protein LDX57_008716 [Aspergillus melleus]|uniref:uncharacterized protein n=1 Tax=Aspergillus melleus TaxID=138277 RepID=UPI001E8E8F4D|nr:uncharacterized protein LDX57_008716 [Aspergillus melleus]KAH8431055.1 hypothetical protein LDX57_008716 [Aspergillus melleus]
MLTFQNGPYFISGNQYWRKPQPSTWTRELAQRDGVDSGASVKIYRSTKCRTLCSVINPNAREVFEQKPPSGEALDSFGFEIDPLSHPDQVSKEILVIIRRGKHAHNVENVTVPPHEQDIRQWSGGMDWEGIKRASCLDQLRYIIPVHPELEDIVGTDSDDDADDYSSMTSYALRFG